MSDLVGWLRAQLDEDERVALAASPGPWKPNAEHDEVLAVDDELAAAGFALSSNQLRATVDHIARHDPARVLAEVEAKRRLLDLHAPRPSYIGDMAQCSHCADLCHGDGYGCLAPDAPYPCDTVRLLALPFAGRDGYDETWRPE